MLQQLLFLNFNYMLRNIFILLFSFSIYSQGTLMVDSEKSSLSYDAKHFLHAWSGVNDNISGVIVYDKEISKIAIAAKVVDFDSGNSNRDAHSLEVLEALKFPIIKFYSDDIKYKSDSLIINGKLEFHGQTKNIIVNSKLNDSNEYIQINGFFNVIPTDFLIKLPSFMLAEIKDLLNIKFDLYFKK